MKTPALIVLLVISGVIMLGSIAGLFFTGYSFARNSRHTGTIEIRMAIESYEPLFEKEYNREEPSEISRSDIEQTVTENANQQVVHTLQNRLKNYGAYDSRVTMGGDGVITAVLPMRYKPDDLSVYLTRTAKLEIRAVADGPEADAETLRQLHGGIVPDNLELVRGAEKPAELWKPWYLLDREAVLTGADIDKANRVRDEYGMWAISITLTRDAGRRFAFYTETHLDERLAIVLDDIVLSAPVIKSRISDRVQITGDFTMSEAEQLVNQLHAGALPLPVKVLGMSVHAADRSSLNRQYLPVGVILGFATLAGIAGTVIFAVMLANRQTKLSHIQMLR